MISQCEGHNRYPPASSNTFCDNGPDKLLLTALLLYYLASSLSIFLYTYTSLEDVRWCSCIYQELKSVKGNISIEKSG